MDERWLLMMVRSWLHVVFVLLLLLWPLGLVGAAVVAAERPAAEPQVRIAAVFYLAGSFLCHQQADRSFRIGDVPLPVCARCFGLYAAAPFGLVAGLALTRVRAARAVLVMAALPTVATVALEWAGVPVPAAVRALAALPLGAAVAWLADATLRGRLV